MQKIYKEVVGGLVMYIRFESEEIKYIKKVELENNCRIEYKLTEYT